jgi:hypothetical protein
MTPAGGPPTDLAGLVNAFVSAAEDLFGAPVYAQRLLAGGELEADWSEGHAPLAEFDLETGGPLLLGRRLSAQLAASIMGLRQHAAGTRQLTAGEVAGIKDSLTSLLHEVIHAIGPADPAVAETDWWTAHRYPHAGVATEGLAELAAQLFIDDILEASGLAAVEPRLLSVTLPERPYPGPEAAMRALVGRVSTRTRRLVVADPAHPQRSPEEARLRAEVVQMVGEGTGDRPVAEMVQRLLRAESVDLVPRPQYPAAFAAVVQRIDSALDHVAARGDIRGSRDLGAAVGNQTMDDIEAYISTVQRRLPPFTDPASPPPNSFRARSRPVGPRRGDVQVDRELG